MLIVGVDVRLADHGDEDNSGVGCVGGVGLRREEPERNVEEKIFGHGS